jgi:two-component system response regulator NreC
MQEMVPPSEIVAKSAPVASRVLDGLVKMEQEAVRVLLIDDHQIVREGLVALLEKFEDMDVVGHGACVEDCLDLIAQEEPDLIITDLTSNGVSPFELANSIGKLGRKIPVLYLVSSVTENNLERGLEAGAAGFISKNESIAGILSAIRQVSEGKKYFSEDIKDRLISRFSFDPSQSFYSPRRSLLSPREVEVLCCVAKGMKAKDIGKSLHITAKTVERHKSNIMAKLGLHSQVDLATYAIREGYICA